MLETLLAWLPLVIIMVAVVFFSRRSMKSYAAHVAHVEKINNELVEINREMIAELREIKQILKDQK